MTWNWLALVAALLAGTTALYIRLRWRRAPQAFTAMVAVAVCYFVAGAILGGWVVRQLGLKTASSAPGLSGRAPVGAPERPLQLPSLAVSPEAAATTPAGYYCGTERWAVKTLSDEDASKVNLKPVTATVGQLIGLPRPTTVMENRRAAPVELTT
jgi:hypothetical protein